MKVPEKNLITLLQNKDKRAIALLYDHYAPALYGVVLRIMDSEELAEDVVQETFMKAWNNSASYCQEKGTLFTWILNIARNTAIDQTRSVHYKARKKIQALETDPLYNQQIVEQYPAYIGLEKLVNALEEKYKIIIDLIFFKGLTQQEIAAHLGIPLGTVKTRLKAALRKLRYSFEDYKPKANFWVVSLSLWLIF